MSPFDVTAPFWAEKVLKTANFPNSRKARFFSVRRQVSETPLDFRFRPEKAAKIHPAELVTACHRYVTPPFLAEKVPKNGQLPDFPKTSFFTQFSVFRPSTAACRGPHPCPDVLRRVQNLGNIESILNRLERILVRVSSTLPGFEPQTRVVQRQRLTTEPRELLLGWQKQPAELVTVCHRYVTGMSPLVAGARFWVEKAARRACHRLSPVCHPFCDSSFLQGFGTVFRHASTSPVCHRRDSSPGMLQIAKTGLDH